MVNACVKQTDIGLVLNIESYKIFFTFFRYLVDNATREGVEQILSAFPFEHDKQHALAILHTVRYFYDMST